MTARISLLACTIVTLLAAVGGCGLDSGERDRDSNRGEPLYVSHPRVFSSFSLDAGRYASCAEVGSEIAAIKERLAIVNSSERVTMSHAKSSGSGDRTDGGGAAPGAADNVSLPEQAPGAGDITTNVQEAGIDEGDLFKASKHHVFVGDSGRVSVVDRTGMRHLGFLSLDRSGSLSELYVHGDQLIVLETLTGRSSRRQNGYPVWQTTTRIRSFRLEPGALPRQQARVDIEGSLRGSRIHAGRLVVVVLDDLSHLGTEELAGSNVAGIPCKNVWKPAFKNTSASLTKLLSFDPAALTAPPASTALLGGGDDLYVSQSAVYAATFVRSDTPVVAPFSSVEGSAALLHRARVAHASTMGSQAEAFSLTSVQSMPGQDRILIQRVAFLGKSGFGRASLGEVLGRTKDRWAYKELADGKHLSVATTTGSLWESGARAAKNHLTILRVDGERLRKTGSLDGYGRNEDIRAVRYVGHMAYVVTFKKTDPLFAIDLSDPRAPRLRGELKIPGYSTYLHPVAPGRLVGVGYETTERGEWAIREGIQVSLFDVSNPARPERLDVKVLGGPGSQSAVNEDSRAFFHDPQTGIVAIPVSLAEASDTTGKRGFTGAVLYDIRGDALLEAGRLTHTGLPEGDANSGPNLSPCAWGSDNPTAVERVFKLGGVLVSLARTSIAEWNAPGSSQPERHVAWKSEQRCDGTESPWRPGPAAFVD